MKIHLPDPKVNSHILQDKITGGFRYPPNIQIAFVTVKLYTLKISPNKHQQAYSVIR